MQKILPKVRMQVSDATVTICFSSKLFWKQVTSEEKVFLPMPTNFLPQEPEVFCFFEVPKSYIFGLNIFATTWKI